MCGRGAAVPVSALFTRFVTSADFISMFGTSTGLMQDPMYTLGLTSLAGVQALQ